MQIGLGMIPGGRGLVCECLFEEGATHAHHPAHAQRHADRHRHDSALREAEQLRGDAHAWGLRHARVAPHARVSDCLMTLRHPCFAAAVSLQAG